MSQNGKPTVPQAPTRKTEQENRSTGRQKDKKVFLVAAFRHEGSLADGPVTGMAEDVVAVIGMAGGEKRFAWVGVSWEDSIINPAMVTPVKVRLAVASPWHPESEKVATGLVQLAPDQLGTGSVDDDIDHLLTELATSRGAAPARGA